MKSAWKWIALGFFLLILAWVVLPNHIVPKPHPRDIHDQTNDGLILMLALNGASWWDQVDQEVILRENDPTMIDALKVAASDANIDRLVHANYLLFRMRIEPEIRLNILFDRLKNHEDSWALSHVFSAEFGPEDIDYINEFEALVNDNLSDRYVAGTGRNAISLIMKSQFSGNAQ
jgi:hypothetical protein